VVLLRRTARHSACRSPGIEPAALMTTSESPMSSLSAPNTSAEPAARVIAVVALVDDLLPRVVELARVLLVRLVRAPPRERRGQRVERFLRVRDEHLRTVLGGVEAGDVDVDETHVLGGEDRYGWRS